MHGRKPPAAYSLARVEGASKIRAKEKPPKPFGWFLQFYFKPPKIA